MLDVLPSNFEETCQDRNKEYDEYDEVYSSLCEKYSDSSREQCFQFVESILQYLCIESDDPSIINTKFSEINPQADKLYAEIETPGSFILDFNQLPRQLILGISAQSQISINGDTQNKVSFLTLENDFEVEECDLNVHTLCLMRSVISLNSKHKIKTTFFLTDFEANSNLVQNPAYFDMIDTSVYGVFDCNLPFYLYDKHRICHYEVIFNSDSMKIIINVQNENCDTCYDKETTVFYNISKNMCFILQPSNVEFIKNDSFEIPVVLNFTFAFFDPAIKPAEHLQLGEVDKIKINISKGNWKTTSENSKILITYDHFLFDVDTSKVNDIFDIQEDELFSFIEKVNTSEPENKNVDNEKGKKNKNLLILIGIVVLFVLIIAIAVIAALLKMRKKVHQKSSNENQS